jgi:UDP-sugar pyrophosphorylase
LLLLLFRTINVEYNQLDPLLKASGLKGDFNDENTGFSPYPGNINQLLFRLEDYVSALELSRGIMPEFVNPKYADDERTVFKKPTRLECMMQVSYSNKTNVSQQHHP